MGFMGGGGGGGNQGPDPATEEYEAQQQKAAQDAANAERARRNALGGANSLYYAQTGQAGVQTLGGTA
jgi:hypothetical protein